MSDKPSYLGLLNAIALGEGQAERYLEAWIAVTPRADVRGVLSAVMVREGEHSKSFAKRINELGYSVQPRDDGGEAERMAVASSTTLTDREKFDRLRLGRPVDPSKPDFLAGLFADPTIDIQTGTLLGRYISEERDSGRLLRGCYEALCAEEEASSSPAADGAVTDRLAALEACVAGVDQRLGSIEAALVKLAGKSSGKK